MLNLYKYIHVSTEPWGTPASRHFISEELPYYININKHIVTPEMYVWLYTCLLVQS